MDRFELVSTYKLSPHIQLNMADEIVYKYTNSNKVIFALEHFSKNYYFSYQGVVSEVFNNYEDETQFDKNYNTFIEKLVDKFI